MIKKLYLEGKFADWLVVHAGSYTSPWVPFVEGLYGYRYIEKLTVDRLGFGPNSRLGPECDRQVRARIRYWAIRSPS